MRRLHKARIALRAGIFGVLLPLAMAGCSRMKFADQAVEPVPDDPKEDIVLTGVVTDATSGSAIVRRVFAQQAVFKSSQKYLTMDHLKIDMLNENGGLAGETVATSGVVYLQPDSKTKRGKNDIELTGDVEHRIPNPKEPDKTSARLETSSVLWDNAAERFRGEEAYQLTMTQSGSGAPVVTFGDGFVVTQDLKKWSVKHGAIGSGQSGDPRTSAAAVRKELEQRSSEGTGEGP